VQRGECLLARLGQADAARAERHLAAREPLARYDHPWGQAALVEVGGLEDAIRDRARHDHDRVRARGQRVGDDEQAARAEDRGGQPGAHQDADEDEGRTHGGGVSATAQPKSKGAKADA